METRNSISKAIKKYQNENNLNANTEEMDFEKMLTTGIEINIANEQQKRFFALTFLKRISDYEYGLNGEYFPFSIKELCFVERCKECVKTLKKIFSNDKLTKEVTAIYKIYEKLRKFVNNKKLKNCIKNIKCANDIFNQTRDFFRLNSSKNKPVSRVKEPINKKSIIEDFDIKIKDFKRNLNLYKNDDNEKQYANIVIKYIDKYRDNLTGHTLIHKYNNKEFLINIPRTNNIMETLFGSFKRKMRQKIGCKKLTNHFRGMHPDEFLIENLTNQKYLDLLYNGSINNAINIFPKFDKEAKEKSIKRKNNKRFFNIKKSVLRDDNFHENILIAFLKFLQSA